MDDARDDHADGRFDDEFDERFDEDFEDRTDEYADDDPDDYAEDNAEDDADDYAAGNTDVDDYDDRLDDMPDDEGRERRGGRVAELGPFLGGIAAGMVLLGIIWVIVAGGSGGGGNDTSADGAVSGRNGIGSALGGLQAPAHRPTETRLDRCTEAADLLVGPLERGKTALDQWSVHVGAMNKLVVGAITLPQATAFWNQTRIGAQTAVKDFEQADKAVRRHGVDCPTPDLLGSRSSAQLRACSRYVGALKDELDAARIAVTTWDHHVHDMDMLRLGKLSPARATAMWLSMWQRGTDELDRYRAQARTVEGMPGCDATGGASAGRDSRSRMHGAGSGSPAPSPGATESSMDSMG